MHQFDNYTFFVEHEYHPKEIFLKCFDGNQLWYEQLLEERYLKRSKSSGDISFHFVGVISYKNNVICVLPKYFCTSILKDKPNELNLNEIALIIKVLKRAGKTDKVTPDFYNINSNQDSSSSELVLADTIIRDYLEHGFYQKEIETVGISQEGEVNWDLTVDSLNPIFSRGFPVYIDTYSTSHVNEQYYLITEIHKWAIFSSISRYGKILDYHFSFDEDHVKDILDLGQIEYLISVLRKELSQVYTDRRISLLKKLIALISASFLYQEQGLQLYGTGYFHIIWEKACSTVFNNKLSNYLDSIPLPIWHDLLGNSIKKSTLIPDIISINESHFFIFDAKYYIINFNTELKITLDGNPGIGDISKQFLYEIAFSKEKFDQIHNCFLFPKLQEAFFSIFGFTTLALFPDKRIWNISISPNKLFMNYLKNQTEGETQLSKIDTRIKSIIDKA
ncbi:LlaJI family restriction endonuclease [Pontibacter roseus]|uniref:LlaJI family restriction endonuclease n=1 Tax=Pontibacter roseus TaxID=336989 RepID=UPI00036C4F25|nr:LlaJI family restriction endonuclease [Pontibacter roseus]